MKSLLAILCTLATLHAETPAEAHADLVKSFQNHEGWELKYTLSEENDPRVMIALNIEKGGKHVSAEFQTMDGAAMMGFGYYPPADGKDARIFVEQNGNYGSVPLGKDFRAVVEAFIDTEVSGKKFIIDSSANLTKESVGLGVGFKFSKNPPYPWDDEILGSIKSVERADGKIIFLGENEEKITFDAGNGLLLEHFLIGETPRLMKLTSQKPLPHFEARDHGLQGQPKVTEDLMESLTETVAKQHQLIIIAGSLFLKFADGETRKAALLAYEKALVVHYETLETEAPELCDPQDMEPLLEKTVTEVFDKMEKKILDGGCDPKAEFRKNGANFVERVARDFAPRFAKEIAKTPLFKINPEKFAADEREFIEPVLASHRLIMIHHLLKRQLNRQLDLHLNAE